MVNNTTLFGGTWAVDSLEPTSHKLGEVNLGCLWEKGSGDVIGQVLQLIWWENIGES